VPDWITHIAVAYSLALLVNIKRRELVVLGALLPDLFKIFLPLGTIFGFGNDNFLGNYFAPFHTVLGVTLTASLLSTFFKDSLRILPLFVLGAASHLFLDSLLYPFGKTIWFFWPFFTFDAGGFLWPDSLFTPLIAISVCLSFVLWRRREIVQRYSPWYQRRP
jgi:hypothetical protein